MVKISDSLSEDQGSTPCIPTKKTKDEAISIICSDKYHPRNFVDAPLYFQGSWWNVCKNCWTWWKKDAEPRQLLLPGWIASCESL